MQKLFKFEGNKRQVTKAICNVPRISPQLSTSSSAYKVNKQVDMWENLRHSTVKFSHTDFLCFLYFLPRQSTKHKRDAKCEKLLFFHPPGDLEIIFVGETSRVCCDCPSHFTHVGDGHHLGCCGRTSNLPLRTSRGH